MSARALIEAASPSTLQVTFQGKQFPMELQNLTHPVLLAELIRRSGANDEASFVRRFNGAQIHLEAGPKDTNTFPVSELVDWVRAVERNKV